jgi:glutamate dehydrogenase
LNVYHTSQKYSVNMKVAAYIEGIRKIAEASQLRGWIRF